MENKVIIEIYGETDLKKSGGYKKKNNVLKMEKEVFFKYLKENNLNIESEYIDIRGTISNNKRFRASYNKMIIGVSDLVKEFNLLK